MSLKHFATACAVVLCLFFSCSFVLAQNAPTVRTAQGEAKGKWIRNGSQKAFLGLPYAAPPVGDLRWKAPQPPVRWSGVRDATKFGARCEQWHVWDDYIFQDAGPSEDCLFLNVYSPAKAKATSKLPVMVWIHGGGFIAGAGSEPRYSDSPLVDRGGVLVTLNYRLGVFGFLATSDLARENGGHAGNYGLMDMVAALQWVRANIGAFGGDANNVTIFGESAGSFAVSALTVAPSAHGLFHKLIGESGALFNGAIPMGTMDQRGKHDQAWADATGAKTLAELRAMPADKVLDAVKNSKGAGFSPVQDGVFLPESLQDAYAAGHQAHVPAIIGWNHDERTGTVSKDMTAAKWKAYAKEHYGTRADEFLKAFPGNTDEQAVRSADDLTTAQFIALAPWKWAEADVATGKVPVYRYRFDQLSPTERLHPLPRAFHSAELEYVFGTLDVRQGATWTPEAHTLSTQMMDYWTNFAKTGDPNGAGLPKWPRYDKEKAVIHLDSTITAGPDATRAEFEFLTSAEAKH
ncbi:carboxylesterase/lipase family protein [Terriglobus sp. ADX1]|uniref:carboxylesterase/lipase family protein n=1 Tax=Terriglobus sp. ADX1 TaxID=2794063 RepID=UPI002FE560F6